MAQVLPVGCLFVRQVRPQRDHPRRNRLGGRPAPLAQRTDNGDMIGVALVLIEFEAALHVSTVISITTIDSISVARRCDDNMMSATQGGFGASADSNCATRRSRWSAVWEVGTTCTGPQSCTVS